MSSAVGKVALRICSRCMVPCGTSVKEAPLSRMGACHDQAFMLLRERVSHLSCSDTGLDLGKAQLSTGKLRFSIGCTNLVLTRARWELQLVRVLDRLLSLVLLLGAGYGVVLECTCFTMQSGCCCWCGQGDAC